MDGNKTEIMVSMSREDFMQKATETIEKTFKEHDDGTKPGASMMMRMTALMFLHDVCKFLFGDNPIVLFSERDFDRAVTESIQSTMDEAAEKGNPVAGIAMASSGILFAFVLCGELFPKEGADNGGEG